MATTCGSSWAIACWYSGEPLRDLRLLALLALRPGRGRDLLLKLIELYVPALELNYFLGPGVHIRGRLGRLATYQNQD